MREGGLFSVLLWFWFRSGCSRALWVCGEKAGRVRFGDVPWVFVVRRVGLCLGPLHLMSCVLSRIRYSIWFSFSLGL
jgi:hypothetical protein